tara:strand:- start:74 stop:688 length:615 start_codon:yes stop_codon:yes gene_type:complete
MNGEYLNIFSAVALTTKLELNIDSLIEFCYEIKCKDEEGVQKSNVGGWQSDDIINETHAEFVKLKNKIETSVNIYHHDIQLKKTYYQKLENIWVNINQKGHSNVYHDHPHSSLSGAFYLTEGEGAPIVFRHPYEDINTYFWDKSIIEEWNNLNSGIWSIRPEPNTLLIFPPWLKHRVSMNEENTDRISFSFNTEILPMNEVFHD